MLGAALPALSQALHSLTLQGVDVLMKQRSFPAASILCGNYKVNRADWARRSPSPPSATELHRSWQPQGPTR
jgi:hypothetical protein